MFISNITNDISPFHHYIMLYKHSIRRIVKHIFVWIVMLRSLDFWWILQRSLNASRKYFPKKLNAYEGALSTVEETCYSNVSQSHFTLGSYTWPICWSSTAVRVQQKMMWYLISENVITIRITLQQLIDDTWLLNRFSSLVGIIDERQKLLVRYVYLKIHPWYEINGFHATFGLSTAHHFRRSKFLEWRDLDLIAPCSWKLTLGARSVRLFGTITYINLSFRSIKIEL